jgi:ABC-2 type transport system ATP-binding protein
MKKPTIQERTETLFQELELTAARKRRVREYSKGMARRLGLACALLHQPEFLVLDEPTSGLDPIGRRKVKDMLLDLRDKGTTILLCSHLLSEVETVCDRVAVMEKGSLLEIGAVKELLAQRELLRVLLKIASSEQEEILRRSLEAVGADIVTIDHPSMTLEELFLKVLGRSKPREAQK